MKPVDIKRKTYINFNKVNNYKDFKFKASGYVTISKYKKFFAKGYIPNWSEKFLLLKS